MCQRDARYLCARAALEFLCATDQQATEHIQGGLQKIATLLGKGASAASEALTHEREAIRMRTDHFDHQMSEPYRFFSERKWNELTFREQVAIGEVMAVETAVPMDREAKRRKPVMFKWMADNWEALRPLALLMEVITEAQIQ
jgi:hypothetical protein